MFEWLTAGSQLRRWLERVKPWSWTTSLHLHTRTLLAQVAGIKWPRTAVVCSPAMLVAKSIIQNCFHQRRWMACCMETAWFFKCLYTHRVKTRNIETLCIQRKLNVYMLSFLHSKWNSLLPSRPELNNACGPTESRLVSPCVPRRDISP